jgi:hypothetical protein
MSNSKADNSDCTRRVKSGRGSPFLFLALILTFLAFTATSALADVCVGTAAGNGAECSINSDCTDGTCVDDGFGGHVCKGGTNDFMACDPNTNCTSPNTCEAGFVDPRALFELDGDQLRTDQNFRAPDDTVLEINTSPGGDQFGKQIAVIGDKDDWGQFEILSSQSGTFGGFPRCMETPYTFSGIATTCVGGSEAGLSCNGGLANQICEDAGGECMPDAGSAMASPPIATCSNTGELCDTAAKADACKMAGGMCLVGSCGFVAGPDDGTQADSGDSGDTNAAADTVAGHGGWSLLHDFNRDPSKVQSGGNP